MGDLSDMLFSRLGVVIQAENVELNCRADIPHIPGHGSSMTVCTHIIGVVQVVFFVSGAESPTTNKSVFEILDVDTIVNDSNLDGRLNTFPDAKAVLLFGACIIVVFCLQEKLTEFPHAVCSVFSK